MAAQQYVYLICPYLYRNLVTVMMEIQSSYMIQLLLAHNHPNTQSSSAVGSSLHTLAIEAARCLALLPDQTVYHSYILAYFLSQTLSISIPLRPFKEHGYKSQLISTLIYSDLLSQ